MEVSGRRLPSKGSSEGTLTCQPCSLEGENLKADGFCQDCQEYLCTTCVRYHRKTTVSKHHIILDKDNILKNVASQTGKQLCKETCEKHTSEIIMFYCRDHDTVGCGYCMSNDHRACTVDVIPDIAGDFVSGGEYKDIIRTLEDLQANLASMNVTVERDKQATAEMYSSSLNRIKTFRKEIDFYLDRAEKLLITQCERLKKENDEILKDIENDYTSFKSNLDKTYECLTTHSKETADLFVKAKRASSSLNQLERDMKRKKEYTLNKYEFHRNPKFEAIINRNSPLGELISQISPLHVSESYMTGGLRSSSLQEPERSINQGLRPFAPRSAQDLQINDVIKFSRQGGKLSHGTIKFIGHLPGRGDIYLGVELDKEDGKHDGVFEGIRYFKCKPSKGVFVAYNKVIMAWTSY